MGASLNDPQSECYGGKFSNGDWFKTKQKQTHIIELESKYWPKICHHFIMHNNECILPWSFEFVSTTRVAINVIHFTLSIAWVVTEKKQCNYGNTQHWCLHYSEIWENSYYKLVYQIYLPVIDSILKNISWNAWYCAQGFSSAWVILIYSSMRSITDVLYVITFLGLNNFVKFFFIFLMKNNFDKNIFLICFGVKFCFGNELIFGNKCCFGNEWFFFFTNIIT